MGLRFRIFASNGSREDSNKTGRGELPGQRRVVSEGLSEIMVLVPTKIASIMLRCLCISTEVNGVDNFTGMPFPSESTAAINPSALCAHFSCI